VYLLLIPLALLLPPSSQAVKNKKLQILKPSVHQYEDGPALAPDYTWRPGDLVHLTFFISGFTPKGEDRKVGVNYRINALDPQGIKLVETLTGTVDVELAPEDKDWLPKIRAMVQVPPIADTGDYRIEINVKDESSGQEAAEYLTFHVQGRDVPPSDTLVIRNFRFLQSETDGPALSPPAYKPGDAVWARFEITGYRMAEKNRFEVEYGLGVELPDGRRVYDQPTAAVVADESFYPKRYVMGVLSLNTKPDTGKGEYSLVVSVRDKVGGQSYEERHTFRVE
jgi:hypothetical protein